MLLLGSMGIAHAQALPPNFSMTNIMPSISKGTSIAQASDGRLFITELAGALKTYKNGAFYTIHTFPTSRARSEQGLFGLALDPNFNSNGWLYVHYFVYVNGGTGDCHVIQRITVSPPTGGNPQLVAGSQRLVYRLPNLPGGASRHNGGQIVFGNDGYLYMPKGEGEHQEQAEILTNVFGKLIRIDAHSTSASNDEVNGHYGIPPGNPGFAKPEIYASGFRNPWSMTKDPTTGELYIGDVGGKEEINRFNPSQVSGKKFGWGAAGNSGLFNCGDANFVCPMLNYSGGAITNVAVRRNIGTAGAWPAQYQNSVFYSDHSGTWFKYVPIGQATGVTFKDDNQQALGMMFGPVDGNLYYCQYNNEEGLWQIRYEGVTEQPPAITSHPQNTTVNSGATAVLQVAATGGNLAYQWKYAPNGSTTFANLANDAVYAGATTASLSIKAVESKAGQYREAVSNGAGSVTSNIAVLIVNPPNAPPTISFVSPAQGSFFTVPQSINFSATASDPEQGQLPAGAFHWDIEMAHRTSATAWHTHPVTFFDGVKSGSFASTVAGETSPDVWLLLILTVTDNAGNADKDTLAVYPNKVMLRAETVPTGLDMVLMDPVKANADVQAVIGNDGKINAAASQTVSGVKYDFSHWVFSGDVAPELNVTANFQNFIVRPNPATFRAYYVVSSANALQAEDAVFVGPKFGNGYAGYHGTGFVDFQNASGDYVQWNVQLSSTGPFNLAFRYAQSGGNRPLKLTINGVDVAASLAFPGTGSFTTWGAVTTVQNLLAGSNSIRLTAIGSSGGNFDELSYSPAGMTTQYGVTMAVADGSGTLSPATGSTTQVNQGANLAITATPAAGYVFAHWHASAGLILANANSASTEVTANAAGTVEVHFDPAPPQSSITLQAENAVWSGPVLKTGYAGWRGTGFLDFTNASNDYIEWTVTPAAAGTYTLVFRYALLSGNRPLKVTVNGAVAASSLAFPSTTSWSIWGSQSVAAPLIAGANKIRLTAIGSSGGNFDELTVTSGAQAKRAAASGNAFVNRLGIRNTAHSLAGRFIPVGLGGNVDDQAVLDLRLNAPDGREVSALRAPISGLTAFDWDLGEIPGLKPGVYYYRLVISGLAPESESGKLILMP